MRKESILLQEEGEHGYRLCDRKRGGKGEGKEVGSTSK